MKGVVKDIEGLAVKNVDFRQVLYTAQHCQLVVMALKPQEEIGAEVHTRAEVEADHAPAPVLHAPHRGVCNAGQRRSRAYATLLMASAHHWRRSDSHERPGDQDS
jgi:hypothetical protein